MFERLRRRMARQAEDHAKSSAERSEVRGRDDDLMIPKLGRVSGLEEVHGKAENLVDDGRPR